MGHRSEPRAEKSADLRGAADATDASDDPGEAGSSPTTLRTRLLRLDLRRTGGRDRSVTRELESSDDKRREKLRAPGDLRAYISEMHELEVQVFLCQQDKASQLLSCLAFRIPL